jgi:gamma-glutamyltranspeptidase/glutathione hydrolase
VGGRQLTELRGVVAAGSPETVAAGIEMLRRGGNAVDATVAAAFATFVAECTISQTGGSGFALVCPPDASPVLYDFFGVMPGLGGDPSSQRELDFRESLLEFEATIGMYYIGRGSVAVPGNPLGLCTLAADFGRLSLSTLLQPTIRLAREGVVISASQASIGRLIKPIITATPSISNIFSPDGQFIQVGDRLRNPNLVTTLERLADEGPELFYKGDMATAIVADQAESGGLITAEDLARYEVERREPLRLTYRDVTVLTNPPPSSGGALIAFGLRLLEGFDVGGLVHGLEEHLALLAEVMRVTNLVRRESDPAQLIRPSDIDGLLCETHVAPHRAHIADALATGRAGVAQAGKPYRRGSTTHISVIDSEGMAVGLTTSPGESAGYAVANTGIIMNNLLGEADLHPQGFHRLPPGTRLSSMMAPTVILKDGKPRAVLGSGGSNRLRTAILQAIINIVDFGLSPRQVVDEPRIHFEGDVLELEGGYNPDAADALERMGYQVNRWSSRSMFFGGVHMAVEGADGLDGAGDKRRGGAYGVLD